MSNWRIGSKVVCIEDSWIAPHCVANFPRRGEVYVVRGTGDRPILIFANFLASMMGGHPSSGLLLREINSGPCACQKVSERCFDQTAFRPVIEDESKSKEQVEQLKKLTGTMREAKTKEAVND